MRYDTLSYDEVLEKRLGVMDAAAIAICRDNKMPIRVFSITKKGSLMSAMQDEKEGTLVLPGDSR